MKKQLVIEGKHSGHDKAIDDVSRYTDGIIEQVTDYTFGNLRGKGYGVKLYNGYIPENWEELKSFCKDIKDIQIVSNVIYLEQEDLGRIELYIDGVIICNEYVIAEDRTAAQMWKFILSLTEKNNVVDRKR